MLLCVALMLIGTLASLGWCAGTSGILVAEQAHRRFDVLAALPIGTPGASWTMSTGYLHRRRAFRWLHAHNSEHHELDALLRARQR